MRKMFWKLEACGLVLGAMLPLHVLSIGLIAASAQGQTAASASRFLGTVTAVGAGLLTVRTDAGLERKVTVPDGIKLQRIAPGEKDLSKAATIQFSELAVGDRVLVRLAPEPATDPVTAIAIIAIPQADLAQKQQREREEWQRQGVGGLVKSVDAGTGIVVITSGAGPMQKTITLRTTPATVLRRYAANSVSFDEAKPAPMEVIKIGDQLRARGTKNSDGTELTAEEIVSGSFRNISGTILTVNQGAMTISLKDLVTKQAVTVHVGQDAQMRKLPEMMARILSNVTKQAGAGGGAGAAAGMPAARPDAARPDAARPDAARPDAARPDGMAGMPPSGAGPGGSSAGMGGAPGGGRPGGDLQQMLSHAPVIHLSDLQKGDAVMLVSTQGTNDVAAVTLLAGVEPLLEAPASTQNMLLSGWNMSSGGEAAQ